MSVFEPPLLSDFSPNNQQTDATDFLRQFGMFLALFLGGLVFYDLLRYFAPGHCYYRATASLYRSDDSHDGTPLQSAERPPNYPLAWVLPTLRYPFKKLVVTHGLDVAMYIRFLQTHIRIFVVLAIHTSLTLLPLYLTSSLNSNSDSGEENGLTDLELASMANLQPSSHRLWGTLLSEIIVMIVVLLLLYWDIREYTKQRIRYRSEFRKSPSNFTVLIMDIPKKDQCDCRIFDQFNSIFPGQVAAVHMVRNGGTLLAMKTRLIFLLNKQKRLLDDQPEDAEEQRPAEILPEPISVAPLTLSYSIDVDAFSEYIDDRRYSMVDEDMFDDEPGPLQEQESVSTPILPTHTNSPARSQRTIEEHRAINREVEVAKKVIAEKEADLDQSAKISHAAFVMFRSQTAASYAVTAPIFRSSDRPVTMRAPDPRAINWNRIYISNYTTRVRSYVSGAALTAMTILWVVPSFLIQALADLEEFGKVLANDGNETVSKFVEANPELAGVLMTFIPPVLLFIALSIAPQIFRLVIRFERIPSQVRVEDKVSDFLFFFFVMSNFFYQVSVNFVFQLWFAFVKNLKNQTPEAIDFIKIISTAVPKKATFLMSYVVVNAFIGNVFLMLNTGRLIFRPIFQWRAKTDRDRMVADRVFADFPFAKMYALCLMISLISLVYSTIAPIFNVIACMYFSIAYLCTKQVLLHSHRPMFEGGGYLYGHAWTGIWVGLLVHQLIIAAIFFLMDAKSQGIISLIYPLLSTMFYFAARNKFSLRIEHGSVLDQSEADTRMDGSVIHEIPSDFIEMYIHPGVRSVRSLMSDGHKVGHSDEDN